MQVVPKRIKQRRVKKTKTKTQAKNSSSSLLHNSINSLVSNNTTTWNFNININLNRQESSKSNKYQKKPTVSQFNKLSEDKLE